MLQRFILLCAPRTGSTLLTAALHQHPAVVMFNEIFAVDESFRRSQGAAGFGPADFYRDGTDPVPFLREQVFGAAFPPGKRAIGFKLFYTHMRTGPAARLWDWLAAEKDVRIIHLLRGRLLESYVSFLIASKTREWLVPVSAGAHAAQAAPITIDVDQFKHYADQQREGIKRAENLFRDHPCLTLEYHDDLCARFDDTIRKIEAFLSVESMPLPKKLQKQARAPLSEEVANFGELHDTLEGTEYEGFL